MTFVKGLMAAALLLPIAACGDKGGGGDAKPEGKLDQAQLQAFVPFFPPAPKGFQINGGPQFKTGDAKSTVWEVYQTPGGEAFSVEINVSTAEAAKYQAMIDDNGARTKAGAELKDMQGKSALTFNSHQMTPAQYVMVVSPSRFVSATPIYGDKIKPIMSYVFEQVDFDGIAAK